MKALCVGPDCVRAKYTGGLCHAHSAQQTTGVILTVLPPARSVQPSRTRTEGTVTALPAMPHQAPAVPSSAGRPDAPPPVKGTSEARLTLTSSDADVDTGPVDRPITCAADWAPVLRHFGLDPDTFEIVDDTVRMSSWQTSRGLDDGTRSTVTLWAYRARFKRTAVRLPGLDLDALATRVHKFRPRPTPVRRVILGAPSTFTTVTADWQLGKGEGEGVTGTVARVHDALQQSVDRLLELRRAGRNVTAGAMLDSGDSTESPCGHYDTQLFEATLTTREQLLLAGDLKALWIRTMAPLVDDYLVAGSLCNHGEFGSTGTGTKQQTSASDNSTAYVLEVLKRILDGRPGYDHIQWGIPHDEYVTLHNLTGVPVAMTHGHKMPGGKAEEDWLKSQGIRILREHGIEPRLWITGHRHHVDVKDFGWANRIQCPSLDYGSKWLADQGGKWSSPGTLTMLVGQHEQAGGSMDRASFRGFSDLQVLAPSLGTPQSARPIGARWAA